MLTVKALSAGYAGTRIIAGLDLDVAPGEIVGLLGRNGAGKTTLVNTLMGILPAMAGAVCIGDCDVTRLRPDLRSRRGLAVVPQGRRVFGSLTVEETIDLARRSGNGWSFERACSSFPRLAERRNTLARNLSGGEQSALSFVRALATGPRYLLLDEPSEGMSPQVLSTLAEVIDDLREDGVGVLLVEQNLPFALDTCDRLLVMSRGAVVDSLTAAAARTDPDAVRRHLLMQTGSQPAQPQPSADAH
jgi:branched-chain amino acid transport system ATP-binding protein